MTTLTIDVREHDLIKLCEEHKIDITKGNLEVGDALLHNPVTNDTLVFERKSVADLAASIKDGRFREQKQRLQATYPVDRITYIVEGFSFKKLSGAKPVQGMPSSALISALISLSYRDGFHVIQTTNTLDTMYALKEIMTRMESHPDKIQRATEATNEESYLASLKVKTKKIDNLTPDLCFLLQLGQVPGISTTLAQDIVKFYPKMSLLLDEIKAKGVKAFADVPGIGPKKAETLVEYLA